MGAWTQLYWKGQEGAPGSPLGFAIVALKHELAHNGYGKGLVLDGLTFGVTMTERVREFQEAAQITVDGVIGPTTAKQLYRKRFSELETNYGLPAGTVCRVCSLESAVDPGAVGVADPADHGIMQINAAEHPAISLAEAFNAAWSLNYFARQTAQTHGSLGDWECSVAAWNIGGGGAQWWCDQGKPATGGPSWFPDLASRATTYIQLVEGEAC